jgi:DNA-binding transcriptional MerR regulator
MKPTKSPGGAGPQNGCEVPVNFVFYACPTLALACRPPGEAPRFPLGAAAHLTGVHPDLILYYCRLGLLSHYRLAMTDEITFDAAALEEIHQIEHYRRNLGVHRRALPLLCGLRDEARELHIDLPFLEAPVEGSRGGKARRAGARK